mmetsp:Transcript_55/g.88  ORF Transcript_55/g.88 Transcript_55/m.88 type:complete len:233 (+) Transcript_55:158-856(+)
MDSLRLPLMPSSSDSAEKSSAKMLVISFWMSASSHRYDTRSRKRASCGALAAPAFSVGSMSSGVYCTALGRGRLAPACTAASDEGGTACTAMSCSDLRRSKLGSLKGRHSIWLLFHSSCASLSPSLKGWLNSPRLRDTMMRTGSRRARTLASSISTSLPWLTQGLTLRAFLDRGLARSSAARICSSTSSCLRRAPSSTMNDHVSATSLRSAIWKLLPSPKMSSSLMTRHSGS